MSLNEESLNSTPIDGIEILVNLAKCGKIDPWNIDICEVTDQYLKILGELKFQDLKLTGKTLLYAAILLRMKSDSLSGVNFLESAAFSQEDAQDDDFVDIGLTDESASKGKVTMLFDAMERFIERRTSVKQPRNRKVTLNDLILELKKYEELEERRRLKEAVERASRRRIKSLTDLSSEDIVELAHEEFIEDTIFRIKRILERFFLEDDSISLSQLETEGKIDRVSAFIALLFLVSSGEVDLYQESFYSELYITCQAGRELASSNSIDSLEMAG